MKNVETNIVWIVAIICVTILWGMEIHLPSPQLKPIHDTIIVHDTGIKQIGNNNKQVNNL